MRRFVLRIGLMIAAAGLLSQCQAFGASCGAEPPCATTTTGTPCCKKCCKPCCQPCCQQCTVMKTCQEVVYEYKEMTAYKVVYEDVEDKVKVPCVEYEPAPRPACVPDTVLVPPMPGACPPAACPPANASPLVRPQSGADVDLSQGNA